MSRSTIIALLVLAGAIGTPAGAAPTIDAEVRATIERYYAAIDRGDFRTAYGMYGGLKTYDEFRQGFARTARVRVAVGPAGDTSVADGEIGTNVSVDVYAVLKNGGRQHFRGNYSLFRNVGPSGVAPSPWRITAGCLSTAGRGGCSYRPYRSAEVSPRLNRR